MKTIVTALISQQIKTNLQEEAESKGITLSKLIYKILKQYEQTYIAKTLRFLLSPTIYLMVS